MDNRDRILGGLYGLLVGDALGVPYEFHSAASIPATGKIEYAPPRGFSRAHPGTPAGTWSDDGAQALVLLDSLIARGRLDVSDLARHIIAWHDTGYMAVDRRVFDVGTQTVNSIWRIKSGGALLGDLGSDPMCGNGSLMRSLPLALWHTGSDLELVRDAHRQSAVTHGQIIGQVSCALYCLWARRTLHGSANAWEDAVKSLRRLYAGDKTRTYQLNNVIRPDDHPRGRGTGYVVDCLNSARLACSIGDTYEDVVRFAIRLGNDTDTTACVAGGIAGIEYGYDTIPHRWRMGLRGAGLVAQISERLLAHLSVETA